MKKNNENLTKIKKYSKKILKGVFNKIKFNYFGYLFSRRKVVKFRILNKDLFGYDLFLLLDSHLSQHLKVNELMINYHRKAFGNRNILLLNAPTLLVLENEIYQNNLIFDFDLIIKTAKESESVGYANYKGIDGVEIYSLVSDTSKTVLREIYEKISSYTDSDLDDLLAKDEIIEKLIWVDLSLVLKNSKRDKTNIKQNLIIKTIIFHYELLKYILDSRKKNILSLFNNSIYSLNQASVQYIKKNRQDVVCRYLLSFHEGNKLTRFKIVDHPSKDAFYRRKFFINYRDNNLIEKAFLFTKNFLNVNVFGSSPFKYSPEVSENTALTAHSALDIDPNKPIYAYFTSSPDEELVSDIMNEGLYANNTITRKPYSDELEAIRALAIETNSQGAHLIVRFHPRLDIESRVPLQSDNYLPFLEGVKKIKKTFSNVHIIYANQQISSYWLAGWADQTFSLRSSMGNVLPIMGLPVVIMSDNRGANVAGYESLIMKERLDFPKSPSRRKFDFDNLINLVCGFYVTNCHASFGKDELDKDHFIDLYRLSIDTGYSSLAFISAPSTDLYGLFSNEDALPLLKEYLIYLTQKLKQMSDIKDYPHLKVCTELLENL